MAINPTDKVCRTKEGDPWAFLRNLITGQKQKMLQTVKTTHEVASGLLEAVLD